MKTIPTSPHPANDRGSAMILVLTLMVLMMALVVGNSLALSQLRQQLRLLERQQQRAWQPAKPLRSAP